MGEVMMTCSGALHNTFTMYYLKMWSKRSEVSTNWVQLWQIDFSPLNLHLSYIYLHLVMVAQLNYRSYQLKKKDEDRRRMRRMMRHQKMIHQQSQTTQATHSTSVHSSSSTSLKPRMDN
jgi:hypothetical protein